MTAAEAAVMESTSDSFSWSEEMTLASTCTSSGRPLGNNGRIGRSMRRETRVSRSDGRPISRRKKLPVLLFIRGEQYFDDVDPDATELTTEGTLELTEEGLLLTYQETALTGMEGTTTTFEVSGPQVILRRVGSVNSQMVFEEGRQHTSLYETPYGELSVDIQTSALRHNLSERGGLLEIKYSIAVEHTVTGRNSFKIRVKRK